MTEINLDSFLKDKPVRNLSGHERGLAAREFFQLDELDTLDGEIIITISPEIDAIASSFFQGMFAKSIQALQGGDYFLRHYKFRASPSVFNQIEQGIRRVLTKRGSAFAH